MAIGITTTKSSGDGEYHPGKLTGHAIFSCIAGATGGLIFGYDLGITGGVTSMAPFLRDYFPDIYRKQGTAAARDTSQYCKYDSPLLTLFTSSLYLAALVSSLVAAPMTKKFGRRVSMGIGGAVFLAGAVVNAAAAKSYGTGLAMLIIGRVLLGFGVGFANQSVPLYVSEMAPPKHRGKFNNLFQLSITLGIFVANLINFGTAKLSGSKGWRISLGLAAVPALLMMFFAYLLPDTPSSLLVRGKVDEARRVLKGVRGITEDAEIEAEFSDMVAASEASKKVDTPWRNLRQRKHLPHLIMAIFIPFFQQMTGMNIVVFYAPELFTSIGIGANAALASALITGGVNMVSTLLAIYLVDMKGRRYLFLRGGILMFLLQLVVAALIGSKFGTTGQATNISTGFAAGVVVCICIFVSGFAWSWGPLGWLVPSEIFPLEIRSAAQSVVVAVNMLMTFVLGQLFLTLLCHLKFGLFIFFACFIAAMTLFIYLLLPETKGIPIEDVQKVFEDHPVWRKYVEPRDRAELRFRGLELAQKDNN